MIFIYIFWKKKTVITQLNLGNNFVHIIFNLTAAAIGALNRPPIGPLCAFFTM